MWYRRSAITTARGELISWEHVTPFNFCNWLMLKIYFFCAKDFFLSWLHCELLVYLLDLLWPWLNWFNFVMSVIHIRSNCWTLCYTDIVTMWETNHSHPYMDVHCIECVGYIYGMLTQCLFLNGDLHNIVFCLKMRFLLFNSVSVKLLCN